MYVFVSFLIIIFFWLYFVDIFIENEDAYVVAPTNMKWVLVGNNMIAYQHFPGSTNENLLLIGGTTAWSGVWENTVRDLEGKYNIYAIDLPPFGYSVVDEKYKYNLKNQSDSINGFLKNLNIHDTVLIAHSYGAGPAMEAVLQEQSNYKKLIIIDGAIHVDRGRVMGLIFIKKFFSISTVRYLIATFALHLPGFMEGSLKYLVYDNATVDDFWVTIYNQPLKVENQSQKLGKWFYDFVFENGTGLSSKSVNYNNLTVPVDIIWGREDNLTPLKQGLYLQEIIPFSTITTLDNVGHIPMIDNHEYYMEVLKENLSHEKN